MLLGYTLLIELASSLIMTHTERVWVGSRRGRYPLYLVVTGCRRTKMVVADYITYH